VIIAEFTEKLSGVKPSTWQAIRNINARCDETEVLQAYQKIARYDRREEMY
jgi:hypothetical protein